MESLIESSTRARVVPFFVLNGLAEKPRLQQMVREFADARYDGVILHPRAGLRVPYLSEAWFDAISFCVESAAAFGMKSWLYDEYPYPSGVAGGRVLAREPSYVEKHLDIRRFPIKGGGRVACALGEGRLLSVYLVPCDGEGALCWGDARNVMGQTGVHNTTWIDRAHDSRFYYSLDHAPLYLCARSMEYLPVSAFEGQVGEGNWELIAFFQATGGDFIEPYGHYVDVSSAEATAAFIEETHEAYRARLGERFGKDILGVFTDEPKYRNPFPWSDSISRHWQEWQADSRALLGLLPDYPDGELRRSFRETAHQLFLKHWIAPIRQWCDANGMEFIGHISPEEDWWMESRCAGSILPLIREFHIPGCDIIIPGVGDRRHPILNATPVMAVSAAAQNGADYALCEMLACSDHSITTQTIRRIGDWLASVGINFAVPHGCFESLEGLRRYDAPPSYIEPNTNHRFLHHWSDDFRATASRLGPKGVVVETAVVRPMRWLFGVVDEMAAKLLADEVLALALALAEKGIAFHWVDDRDLVEPRVEDGELVVGHARYRRLITVRPFVEAASAAGILSAGEAGVEVLSLAEALQLDGPLHAPEGEVRAVLSRDGGWFCLNLSPEPRVFQLLGESFELEGYESRWVERGQARAEVCAMANLEDWTMTPEGANRLRLKAWQCNGAAVEPGPIYRIFPEQLGVAIGKTVYGSIPLEPTMLEPLHLVYESGFVWAAGVEIPHLVIENGAICGSWRLFLNDVELTEYERGGETEAIGYTRVRLPVRQGENRLRVELMTSDRRDGMLVVPFLEGAFVVACVESLRLEPIPENIEATEWTQSGFPHYSGTMRFETRFDGAALTGEDTAAWLEFSLPPEAMVEVTLNGVNLGAMLWSPWRKELPVAALREGENHLVLRVTNTLYNFIYGRSLRSGLPEGVVLTSRRPASSGASLIGLKSCSGMTLAETAIAVALLAFCAVALLGLLPVMMDSMSDSRERVLATRIYQKMAIALREEPPTASGSRHFTREGLPLPGGQTGAIVVNHSSPSRLLLPDGSEEGYTSQSVDTVSITVRSVVENRTLLERSIYLAR